MASLSKIQFYHAGPTGETMEFDAECSVDSSGIFAIAIPDELVQVARSLGYAVTRPRKKFRLEHKLLDEAKRQVSAAIVEYLAAVETVERVIIYSADLAVSFWQNPDGSIASNGHEGVPREKGGEWAEVGKRNLNATNCVNHFSVGLFAEVVDRHTFTRGSSIKQEYRKPGTYGARPWLEGQVWGAKLNSFSSLARKQNAGSYDSMAYSEEAARFFHDTLLGMCLLARSIDGFFGSPEALRLAIERQVPVLGYSPEPEEASPAASPAASPSVVWHA
ncbi:hypothetical protein [Geopseudomonas aromaticivorans]